MAEQQFREIQLSGKQLVFLFMTTVVLAVAIFLLGVSVGRGTSPSGAAMIEQTAEVIPPSDLPPPTEMTSADLQYHDTLKQQQTPPAEPAPPNEETGSQGEAPEPVQEPAPEPAAAEPEAASSTAPVTPPPAPPARSNDTAAPAPEPQAAGEWALQVGAYSSRANADRQVAQLRAKGFNAFVTSGGPGNLHRVRVGPFGERAEADRVAAQLVREEGLKSSVIR